MCLNIFWTRPVQYKGGGGVGGGGGAEGARQFSSFNDYSNLLYLFIWLQKRAKWDWNGVKIAIFSVKSQKSPSDWRL